MIMSLRPTILKENIEKITKQGYKSIKY